MKFIKRKPVKYLVKQHKLTKEHKNKISKAMKGKVFSKERNQKIGKAISGKNHGMWNGGRIKDFRGYVFIYKPNHPHNCKNYVQEHRLIMEKHLGRFLKPKEVVHHINGKKGDNRIENLMLFSGTGKHVAFHKYLLTIYKIIFPLVFYLFDQEN